MSDDPSHGFGDEEFDDLDGGIEPLDDREIQQVERDLADLVEFEETFRPEGYRGVAVWCRDCMEEHYYPWDMLRENLTSLIETGETPVHEPAFAPQPDQYIPWDYARGYVDALREAGVTDRLPVTACGRCGWELPESVRAANFCPRCGGPLLAVRLVQALEAHGLSAADVDALLRATGLPRRADS